MSYEHDALTRTALLVQRDVFPTLAERQITEQLLTQRVRLRADHANLAEPAGQAAAVAFAVAANQSGVRLQLDLPDVPLAGPHPPLEPIRGLASGLRELCAELVQPADDGYEPAEIVVLLGDTPSVTDAETTIRLSGSAWEGAVQIDPTPIVPRWRGALCFGAHLAGIAGAAECFRAALAALGARAGVQPLPEHEIGAPATVHLTLPPLALDPEAVIDLGAIDLISAGALNNAALSALLCIPNLRGVLRVIDADVVELTNLNRYALVDRRHIGMHKVDALTRFSRDGLAIEALRTRLDNRMPMGPLAPHVLVGVDDIPSRWIAQMRAPAWLCVAATSRMGLVVSEHVPGMPCAACMHPHTQAADGPIPTVSFVSQLAGILAAHRLLNHVLAATTLPPVLAYGLALHSRRPLLTIGQAPCAHCPCGCSAARRWAA